MQAHRKIFSNHFFQIISNHHLQSKFLYLQQDLGHLWDLGDRLGQVDPEERQENVKTK